ncbi:MAG: VOC family protein [Alphaproteobacteria bacterium]|nr:VOC family protein [Alphaproteobacteria bacterium]
MTKKHLTTALTPELYCSDFGASLAFYTQVLGFTVQYKRDEHGFAMLERQGARIMIEQLAQGERTWLTGPLEQPYGRGMNFQIETDRIDELFAHARKCSAAIFLPIEERWYRRDDTYLGNRQFLVQDPDGYLLRFFEDLGERAEPPGLGEAK